MVHSPEEAIPWGAKLFECRNGNLGIQKRSSGSRLFSGMKGTFTQFSGRPAVLLDTGLKVKQ
jgi:hypothetical protein